MVDATYVSVPSGLAPVVRAREDGQPWHRVAVAVAIAVVAAAARWHSWPAEHVRWKAE